MSAPVKVAGESLVFIWNARSGLGNALWDSLHKWVHPDSYSCALCQLTHGFAGPKKEWKAFLASLNRPCVFLYRDQVDQVPWADQQPLPLVGVFRDGALQTILGADEIRELPSLEALQEALRKRVSAMK